MCLTMPAELEQSPLDEVAINSESECSQTVDDDKSDMASEDSSESDVIIRAKWMLDDCLTLDEVLLRLEDQIEYFKTLKSEGWELREKISDDYGFLRQRASVEKSND